MFKSEREYHAELAKESLAELKTLLQESEPGPLRDALDKLVFILEYLLGD